MRRWRTGEELPWSALPGGGYHPFGLSERKAEVLLRIGRWAELEDLYNQDLERASAAGQRKRRAHLLMLQAEMLGWRNEHRQARDRFELAASLFRELGDEKSRLSCENGLAVVYMNLKEYEKAEALIETATAEARKSDHKPALCSLLNSHAVLCRERKQPDKAIACLKERMELSQALGGMTDVASSHMNLAVIYSEQRRYDLALEQNQIALEMGQRMGDVMLQHYALYNQAQMLRKVGRVGECL